MMNNLPARHEVHISMTLALQLLQDLLAGEVVVKLPKGGRDGSQEECG